MKIDTPIQFNKVVPKSSLPLIFPQHIQTSLVVCQDIDSNVYSSESLVPSGQTTLKDKDYITTL